MNCTREERRIIFENLINIFQKFELIKEIIKSTTYGIEDSLDKK